MKLTVPAIRVVEPVPNRDDADKETKELLDAIDALLAESMAEAPTREFERRRRRRWRYTRLRVSSRVAGARSSRRRLSAAAERPG